jgi:hypothetical protein
VPWPAASMESQAHVEDDLLSFPPSQRGPPLSEVYTYCTRACTCVSGLLSAADRSCPTVPLTPAGGIRVTGLLREPAATRVEAPVRRRR